MKTRSLKLPDELDSRLTAYARRRKLTRSVVVREAVSAYLARQDEVQAGAALERLRDLAGSVEGPPDLSTNPDYLLAYGASQRSPRSKRRRQA